VWGPLQERSMRGASGKPSGKRLTAHHNAKLHSTVQDSQIRLGRFLPCSSGLLGAERHARGFSQVELARWCVLTDQLPHGVVYWNQLLALTPITRAFDAYRVL
jgi:hypothetical protein